jgi:hypothetical protein
MKKEAERYPETFLIPNTQYKMNNVKHNIGRIFVHDERLA